MALTKYKLGELIELVLETNSGGIYSSDDVRGMTITKEVIPTKADVSNTDLSNFIIVHPNEFVYNPRTHGKKIGFGFNDTSDCFIISWNNIAFRVKQDAIKKVLPIYLFLHFNREEWDREACYRSWGSSTEVFTWDALCEMELLLPSIETQQKFVDVYTSLQKNLEAYQSKVDDLKLVCDGYIENLKMSVPAKKIGEYIELCDERNTDCTITNVKGLTVFKKFIETKADMEGVALNNYKVVHVGQIAYVSTTNRNGDRVACGLCEEECIVSSIYDVIKCDETCLLPEYLFLWFQRKEFDRWGRYNSWGSARENFTNEDLMNYAIPIPELSIQKEIVNIYKCYIERQRISKELKATLNNLCPILIQGSLQSEK